MTAPIAPDPATPTAPDPATLPPIARVAEIVFPLPLYSSVISHACRKLEGHYLDGETRERKAFGLLAGRLRQDRIEVTAVIPLIVNMRHDSDLTRDMDEVVNAHAIPSETPNAQRGWVANPAEILAAERLCDSEDGWLLFGNYHTHRVAWPEDPVRDSCTQLDRVLAAESGQWTFILSAVDLDRPVLRAYFEGRNEIEAPIRLTPGRAPAGPASAAPAPVTAPVPAR